MRSSLLIVRLVGIGVICGHGCILNGCCNTYLFSHWFQFPLACIPFMWWLFKLHNLIGLVNDATLQFLGKNFLKLSSSSCSSSISSSCSIPSLSELYSTHSSSLPSWLAFGYVSFNSLWMDSFATTSLTFGWETTMQFFWD